MNKPYFLIETANTHGGDYDYLIELIDAFDQYKEGYGIKFQAFHPDRIATKDFPSYKLYQELHFDIKQWEQAIDRAAKTKDVWLDIFDTYGVEVLTANIEKVSGIKFQSSVLYNFEVFRALGLADLSSKKIILNVAAQPLENIGEILNRVQYDLKPGEILLEFGYQAYPTTLDDSGLSKIKIIKANFKNRIVFADHVDGRSDDAILLPLVISASGVDIIEKHVMLEHKETKYDHFSSLTPGKFNEMVGKITLYSSLNEKPFINEKEKIYLRNTMMIPILKIDKPAGSLLDLQNDFEFRRSGRKGLNIKEISAIQTNYHVIAADKKAGEPLFKEDFRKARIGVIIVCRMKSTRLPKKALLPIGDVSSVERCIKNVLRFPEIQTTILATSTLEEDAVLKDYCYRKDVRFFIGDPIDVMQRVLDATDKYELDILSRVTADMPFVSDEIFQILLESHFKAGADYTVPVKLAVGTASNIITATALRKIKSFFPSAEYSEYLPYYFINNPHLVKVNHVNLPEALIRDYRLTLDYQEDLDLMQKIEAYLNERKLDADLREIFSFLDNNKEICNINAHLKLKYLTDQDLIDKLNRFTKINL